MTGFGILLAVVYLVFMVPFAFHAYKAAVQPLFKKANDLELIKRHRKKAWRFFIAGVVAEVMLFLVFFLFIRNS